jgi:hypothetical protein
MGKEGGLSYLKQLMKEMQIPNSLLVDMHLGCRQKDLAATKGNEWEEI